MIYVCDVMEMFQSLPFERAGLDWRVVFDLWRGIEVAHIHLHKALCISFCGSNEDVCE